MNKLKPFQEKAVEFMLKEKHVLLADEMGLGKTIQAIGLMNCIPASTMLVICPASVKIHWLRKIQEWNKVPRHVQIIQTGNDEIRSPVDTIIVNYDLLIKPFIRDQIKKRRFSIGICDEAHYLKGMKSQRTKAVLGTKGVLRNCEYKIMLTGTPMLNRPIELYPILKTLACEYIAPYDTYTKFAYKFCAAYMNDYGLDVKGSSSEEELSARLQFFMLRRTIPEVAPELPERNYEIVYLSNDEIDEVKEKENELIEDRSKVNSDNVELGVMATIRRLTAEAKLPLINEHIAKVLQATNKVVVFTYHRIVALSLHQLYPEGCLVMGGMTTQQKQNQIDKFVKDPEARVFVGQIQAAGQGIDGLQTVCNHVVFAEISWVPGEIKQAVNRCHRMGQTLPVFVQFLIAEGTIEESMLGAMLHKIKIINKVIGTEEKGGMLV